MRDTPISREIERHFQELAKEIAEEAAKWFGLNPFEADQVLRAERP